MKCKLQHAGVAVHQCGLLVFPFSILLLLLLLLLLVLDCSLLSTSEVAQCRAAAAWWDRGDATPTEQSLKMPHKAAAHHTWLG